MALPYRTFILHHRGQKSQEAQLIEEILPTSRQIGDLQVLVPMLVATVMCWSAFDRRSDVTKVLGELFDMSRNAPDWRLLFATDIARGLVEMESADLI
jgi:hypothetical protein